MAILRSNYVCVVTVIYVMCLSFFCDTEIRKQAAKKENTGNK